jgi:3-hydroxybutyrate dehydrogenase
VTRYGLEGRVVVITGAASGIGRALATAFAMEQAQLVLIDRNASALLIAAEELSSTTKVIPFCCDLCDDVALTAITSNLTAQNITIHTLVNSMVRLTRALLPLMGQGSSSINQSSIWGKTGVADYSAYVASKHAVIGLTRALAWELGPRGIRVNAVCPGWIRTDAARASLRSMARALGRSEDDIEREILSRQALVGMLSPDDIAGVYLFLASSDARSMTGQSLVASNGEVMA